MIHFKTFVFVQYHKNEYKYILFLALSFLFQTQVPVESHCIAAFTEAVRLNRALLDYS